MTTATDMLARYLAAEAAILAGKETTWNGKTLRLEDLDKIQAGRREWEQKVSAERASQSGIPTVGGLRISRARFNGQG